MSIVRDPQVWGISWSLRIHQFEIVPVTLDGRVRSSARALCGTDTYLRSYLEELASRPDSWAVPRLASLDDPATAVCKKCAAAAAKAGR